MNLRFSDVLWFSPAVLAFVLSICITLSYPYPLGVDIHEHIKIAKYWLDLNYSGLQEYPYPPLFQWLLVPSVALNVEYGFVRVLQTLFYPLSVLSSMMLVFKQTSNKYKSTLFCGALLLSAFAFFDRTIQAQPQGIDFMLLPLAYYCVLNDRRKDFSVLSILLFLNHAPHSQLAMIGAYFIAYKKGWVKEMIPIAALLVYMTAFWFTRIPYLASFNLFQFNSAQEQAFWTDPAYYLVLQLGPLITAFPIVFYDLFKWKRLDDFEKLSVFTFLSLAPMIFLFADRWVNYVTLPLSYLLTLKMRKSRYRILYAGLCIGFMLLPWIILLVNGYDMRIPT